MALKSTKNTRLVIISGLSGSGKSTALKAFEDIGFFCIDNLPVTLLPRFLDLKDEISKEVFKIALVMDLRGKDFLTRFPKIYQEIKRKGTLIEILFLYAEDEVLARRFSQTRRHHPLGDGQSPIRKYSVGTSENGPHPKVGHLPVGYFQFECAPVTGGDPAIVFPGGIPPAHGRSFGFFRL